MITLRWAPFPGADVSSYRVYRSMIGFRAPIPPLSSISGKTLQLKMNGATALQTITFDGTTPVIAKINASLSGGQAYVSGADSGFFLLRSDIRAAPGSVQIVGGTALSLLGQTARTITEKSEDAQIATVAALADPNQFITYQDCDGVCHDWYTVTTVNSMGEESRKPPYKQSTQYSGPICVLEGIVTNLQGVRMPDVEVVATLVKFPQEIGRAPQITLEPISTLTGPDGRFCIALLQGALVQFDIQAVGFSRNITVPYKPCEFITDLRVDLDYRYPLEYS